MKREQWDAALQFLDDDLLTEALGSSKRKNKNRWQRIAPTLSGILAATLLLTIGLTVWMKRSEPATMDMQESVGSTNNEVVFGQNDSIDGSGTGEMVGNNLQQKEPLSGDVHVNTEVNANAATAPGAKDPIQAPGAKEPVEAPWLVRVLQRILQWMQSWMIVK